MNRAWNDHIDGPLPENMECFYPHYDSTFNIPKKIRILEFPTYSEYNQEFTLPETLTHFALPSNYEIDRKSIKLPNSLLFLNTPSYWVPIPELPHRLKVLKIGSNRNGFIRYKIVRKTKLIFFGLHNYTLELPPSVEYLVLGLICPKLCDTKYCAIVKNIYQKNTNDEFNYVIESNSEKNRKIDMNAVNNGRYIDDKECTYLFWIRERQFTKIEEDYEGYNANYHDDNYAYDDDNDYKYDNEDERQSTNPLINLDKDKLYRMGCSTYHATYWGPTDFEHNL